VPLISRLVNQRLLEVQSQVEELQKSLQDQGSKAGDVSSGMYCNSPEVSQNVEKSYNFYLLLNACKSK
jgi:hypothetical protein